MIFKSNLITSSETQLAILYFKTMVEAGAPWQLESGKVGQRCGYLLTSEHLSDCTFVVGTNDLTEKVVLPAHKLVLAMASPVFEAMFYGGLSERNEPKISIVDVQPEAFKALLQYIYTGVINIGSFDIACDLWLAADKYMLPHLEKECNSYIWSEVGPRNACQVYEFARLFDEETLMDECIQIISTNTKEVLNDSSFEDLELNTVVTVFSLEHLTVDSELDLFRAVVRYAKEEERWQEQVSPPVDGAPSEKLSELKLEPPSSEEKVLFPSVKSSFQTCPASELDSKPPTEVVTSKPERERPIRAAVEKIRFLSLSDQEFAEGPAVSDLLTLDESFAILMNIACADCGVPMPTDFSEYRERRQPRSGSVEEGSIAQLRPKPSTESRGVAATKLPTPAEIVRGLTSHERKTLEKAARAARRMTCADADGSTENLTQLVAAGAIPPLVDALHHPRTGVKYDAAWALINIACDHEHTDALRNDGAALALGGLLAGGGAVAELAAWALGNIAGGGNIASAALHSGVVPALLARMQPGTPSAPLRTFVRTYRCICQIVTQTRQQLTLALTHIGNLLLLTDEQVLVDACWILYHLVERARYDSQLFTPLLAARLTALLRPAAAAPSVQTAALVAVGTTLTMIGVRDLCLEAGCLDYIVHFLKCGNPVQLEYSARAAADILHIPRHIQPALDKGILDALVPALTDGDVKCKYGAVLAITNLCASGSPTQLRALAEGAALESYCRLLAENAALEPYRRLLAGMGDTCYYVLQGLTVLLKKVERNTKIDLLRKLQPIDLPQILKPLCQDLDVRNRELARKLQEACSYP